MILSFRNLIYPLCFLLLTTLSWSQDHSGLRVINTPKEYEEALQTGEKIKVEGLVGRLLRGKTEEDFLKLSPDFGREAVFFMDSEGLASLTSLDQQKMLEAIGYPLKTIEELQKSGVEFKLVVSRPNEGIKLATWDNILELIQKNYPSEVSQKIALAMNQLKSTPFEVLNLQANQMGISFTSDRSSAGFMSSELLAKDSDFVLNQGELSKKAVVKARAFLYSTLNLNELYAGDGYTRTPEGNIGVPEYISSNESLKTLQKNGALIIDNPGVRIKSKGCFSKLLTELSE